jgi:hypothetical protein|tara:strand:- start:280 stop:570 length:291 start_codon:yes stop_codon:yes gene_type:complete
MSHGSEGSKGTTRSRYLAWMEKGPRTKTEMAAYQQGAGRVTSNFNQDSPKPKPNSRQTPIQQRGESNSYSNLMTMPPITNLSIINGEEHKIKKRRN